ncbi:MAG: 23S rRNA (adenine(2503)-C(2))-methyltransferase RlmN [Anaerolineales bacterium]
MDERVNFYDLTFPELSALVEAWGAAAYRARQLWQGAYQHLWHTPAQFSNLPQNLRARLESEIHFDLLEPVTRLESSDGQTVKTLFRLHDGQLIEAVLMRYGDASPKREGGRRVRRTLCISTQAGCGMGCTFCATGQMGFRRHLSSGEIVAQVLYYARKLAEAGEHVTNVVVMGMGEPFHNYDNTLAAIERLNDPQGFNLGARRFTISTVGLVPAIRRFTTAGLQVGLAISLHAADDESRAAMLPIAHKYPLADLMEAVRDYVTQTRRRVTFEWALIEGINDTPETAARLAHLIRHYLPPHMTHVNAIPLNPTQGYHGKAASQQRAEAFRQKLASENISCTIRLRRGIDIQAGCGQLASRESSSPPKTLP